MTREHPEWDRFIHILDALVHVHEVDEDEDLHLRRDSAGDRLTNLRWNCAGDLTQAMAVLAFMEALGIVGPIDIDGTVAYLDAHGGNCDCEVLFNVDGDDGDEEEEDTGVETTIVVDAYPIEMLPVGILLNTGDFEDDDHRGVFTISVDPTGVDVCLRRGRDMTAMQYHFAIDDLVDAAVMALNRDYPDALDMNTDQN